MSLSYLAEDRVKENLSIRSFDATFDRNITVNGNVNGAKLLPPCGIMVVGSASSGNTTLSGGGPWYRFNTTGMGEQEILDNKPGFTFATVDFNSADPHITFTGTENRACQIFVRANVRVTSADTRLLFRLSIDGTTTLDTFKLGDAFVSGVSNPVTFFVPFVTLVGDGSPKAIRFEVEPVGGPSTVQLDSLYISIRCPEVSTSS